MFHFLLLGVPSSSKFVTEGTRPGISEAKDKENSIEGSPQKRRRTVAPQETELDFVGLTKKLSFCCFLINNISFY